MFRKWIDPGSADMNKQGFEPGLIIRGLRQLSKAFIFLLRLTGKTRWSNEFIQSLDPHVVVDASHLFPDAGREKSRLWFRTGHGRLYWRCRQTVDEEPETNEWIGSFQPSDVFYDIGANVGVYSLMASKIMGVRTVSIEPDLMNARLLYENVIMNGVSERVSVLPFAVAERNYTADFFLKSLSYGDALHNLDEKNPLMVAETSLKASVPVFSLDTLVKLLGLPAPTKLKIDVDGAEARILKGAEQSLRSVTSLIVELDKNNPNNEALIEYLAKHGFRLTLQSMPFTSYNECSNGLFERI